MGGRVLCLRGEEGGGFGGRCCLFLRFERLGCGSGYLVLCGFLVRYYKGVYKKMS